METDSRAAASSSFSRFVASNNGRAARVGLGLALIGTGTLLIDWPAGLALATFGLIPLATGAFNLCPVAPIWGGHFWGARYCSVPANSAEGQAPQTFEGKK